MRRFVLSRSPKLLMSVLRVAQLHVSLRLYSSEVEREVKKIRNLL